ncbi:MAG: agmatine deiminase family protein, partial [Helicobacteraceae bacterium]|nr:agmatine deiminase family protein [Helicobacteraceae bacterium]
EKSDWREYLDEALLFYAALLRAITRYEKALLICQDTNAANHWLKSVHIPADRLRIFECETNDTWARDFGFLSVEDNGKTLLMNFEFNGWGLKFAANHDNQINARLDESGIFAPAAMQKNNWILEGGSVESDGKGTIMTTSNCLFAPNRNNAIDRAFFEDVFRRDLGANRIVWIENGHLENDDTDAHIDTLARFCDDETIAFVVCDDKRDTHYEPLAKMKEEILALKRTDGSSYRFVELPMVAPLYYENDRLPASYANFLIINQAVIAPIYGVHTDRKALDMLQRAFPNRVIVPIRSEVVVRQHGSVHCLTMQIPATIGF